MNHSRSGHTCIDVPLTTAVGDIPAVRDAILQVVGAVEGVLRDPPPAVVVKAISPASADLIVQAWISDAEQERPVSFRILEAAKSALDKLSVAVAG